MSYTAQAVALADAEEIGDAIVSATGRCGFSGLAPAAYRGLIRAAVALGARVRRVPPAWTDDAELFAEVADIIDQIMGRLTAIRSLWAQANAALAAELAKDDDDQDATLIADCYNARGVLAAAARGFSHLLMCVATVTDDTHETYQSAYDLVLSGHLMPYEGRFLSGEAATAVY